MNKILAGCIVAVCFFSACADKEPEDDSGLINTTTPANSDAQTVVTTDTAKPAPVQPQVVPMPATPASNVTTTATAPGMNPPHGQPGHRCDIEVGAPLNSPATKPQTQTVSTTPTVTPVTTTAKTVTAPGMNPPHGEPGHRCDIAVGAPLNSPAAPKPAVQKIEPVVMPAKKDSGT
ncbi:MAG: hypothetical protein QM737_09735 [Ferruginibacter sp.]